MEPKKKTQAKHAIKRVSERYGIVLSEQQYRELCNLLSRGKGETLAKQSNTRFIKIIKYNGIVFYVIYDKARHQVATFLTKEMAEETIKNCKN